MPVPRIRVAIAVMAVGLAWPAMTSAHRPATSVEKRALVSDLGLSFTRPACLDASVSTVDPAWASLWFKPPRHGESHRRFLARCHPTDGVVVAQRTHGAWRQVIAGSDIEACPPSVPVRIGEDLRWASHPFCRAPGVMIWCDAPGGDRVLVAHPRRCSTLGPTDPLAAAANLRGLGWEHWGAPVSTARGFDLGYHLPHGHVPVEVRAYRKRRGCRFDFVYTRMRVTSQYGSTLVRYPRCGG